MITKIGLAIIVGAVVGLCCMFAGGLLASMSIPILASVGSFLAAYGWAIGLLAGAWYFFAGGSLSFPRSR